MTFIGYRLPERAYCTNMEQTTASSSFFGIVVSLSNMAGPSEWNFTNLNSFGIFLAPEWFDSFHMGYRMEVKSFTTQVFWV